MLNSSDYQETQTSVFDNTETEPAEPMILKIPQAPVPTYVEISTNKMMAARCMASSKHMCYCQLVVGGTDGMG